MRKKTPRKRRPGKRPKWRPLGTLTEDHCFILSMVTLNPGIEREELRVVYVADCDLVGKAPVTLKTFGIYISYLVS